MGYYILDSTNAAMLSIICMFIGSLATMIGWKISPMISRYLALLKLKYYQYRYKGGFP